MISLKRGGVTNSPVMDKYLLFFYLFLYIYVGIFIKVPVYVNRSHISMHTYLFSA